MSDAGLQSDNLHEDQDYLEDLAADAAAESKDKW
jgi:hypothetical protein